jgi:serine/threonine-protein kinase
MGAIEVELSVDGALGPRSFGKYRLIASLGQGGMANVYLAVVLGPAGFNKLLVVKALREDVLGSSDEFVQMFLDEARLSARLNHPNIVQTYEIGEADGRYFIAMEYLEGQPLRVAQRRLGQEGLPLDENLRIIAETARGLHYAHELKGLDGEALEVVHRDVSPQNVFLTYDGQVKLLDFGIAKARDAEHLTKVGVIKGKLDYIAPEQIRGEVIDRRADVFALGAMLWEAASGARFAGGSKVQDVTKLHRRLTGGEPKLRELRPDLPEALVSIVERALAVDPAARTPTAAQLAEELDVYLEQSGLRPSAKSLSERLAAPFAAERAKIGWMVEEQLKQALSNRADQRLPSLGRADLTQSGSGVRQGPTAGEESGTDPGQMTPSSTAVGQPALGTVSAPAIQAAPSRRGRGAQLAAVLGVVAVVGLLAVLGGGKSTQVATPAAAAPREPSALAPPPSSAQVRPEPEPEAAAASVRVHVFVSPEQASASLDGASLPKLPFSAELPRDGKLHYVEASAPGYASKKVVVPFDRDREVSIVLDRLPLAPASAQPAVDTPRARRRGALEARGSTRESSKPAAASGALAAPSGDSAPGAPLAPKSRLRTDIDTTDPYAN